MDKLGLFKALEAGLFADVKRSPEGGRGLEGVMSRNEGILIRFMRNYWLKWFLNHEQFHILASILTRGITTMQECNFTSYP
jgi:hypothetical protein